MQAAKTIARPAQFDRASQQRRSMLAKVQIAKGQIGINEDDYRQAIFDQSGQMSLAKCTDSQLIKLLDWFKSKGFQPLPKGGKSAASHPTARKARALWISLYHLGEVHNSSEEALEAFAKRQLKCERLAWADQRRAHSLIEALKAMAVRGGWQQSDRATGRPFDVKGLQISLCCAIVVKLKEAAIVPADWTMDRAAWSLCGIETAATASGYTVQDYERLAAALGEKLRKHGGQANG